MQTIRKAAAAIIVVVLFLTGCTTSETSNQVSEIQQTGTENVWPRTYVDSLGYEVVLDKEPKRIVTLMHVLYPDILLSLDVEPIGVAGADTMFNQWEAYSRYTKDKGIADIGSYESPNLEKIYELEPDLIIAASEYHEQAYDQLRAIAPVVYVDYMKTGSDRDEGVREFAKILGKEAEGAAVINKLNQKIAITREELKGLVGEDKTVVFSTANSNGGFWLYNKNITPTSQSGLGLQVPQKYPDGEELVTLEGMALLNPDYLFIFTDNSTDTSSDEALKEYTTSKVWNNISAVKNNHVFIVDRSWFAREAPVATDYGIDALLEIFKKTKL